METLSQSLAVWFKEKTSSPFWYVLLFSFVLWNWQILYLLFFEEASKFSGPRTEYICKVYFSVADKALIGPECNIVNWILHNYWLAVMIFVPVGVAIISVWALPWWNNFVFRKQESFHRQGKLDRAQSDRDYAFQESHLDYDDYDDLTNEYIDQMNTQAINQKELKKRDILNLEYEYPKFIEYANNYIALLREINECKLMKISIEKEKNTAEKRFLRLLFNQWIANIEKDTGIYKFTDKWEFFYKKYLAEPLDITL